MKQFTIGSLFLTFAIIYICHAQDGPIELEKPQTPPFKNEIPDIGPIDIGPQIPPIIINPNVICSLYPSSARCNPCQYGTPNKGIPCGQGQQKCSSIGGTCKVNFYDQAYCCPEDHRGFCPAIPSPPIIIAYPVSQSSLCLPTCKTDAQCEKYQKCCGSCKRCVNATLT